MRLICRKTYKEKIAEQACTFSSITVLQHSYIYTYPLLGDDLYNQRLLLFTEHWYRATVSALFKRVPCTQVFINV